MMLSVIISLHTVYRVAQNLFSEVVFGEPPTSIRLAISLARLMQFESINAEQPQIGPANYQIITILCGGMTLEGLGARCPSNQHGRDANV